MTKSDLAQAPSPGRPGAITIWAVAFAAGVWALQQQATLPGPLWTYLLPVIVLMNALLLCSPSSAVRSAGWILTAIACLAAGFLYASLRAQLRLAEELPRVLEGQELRIVGVIAEMPQPGERGQRFVFAVEHGTSAQVRLPGKISLTWYEDSAKSVEVPELHAGQRWQLTVRLRRPHGAANPHGFDSELWLLERGIRATGYVRPGDHRLLDAMVQGPMSWIERIREQARARIHRAVRNTSSAGLLTALAVGDQQAIPAADWLVFTRTGVNHLISISGLHITMLAGLVLVLVRPLWNRLGAAPLRLPAQEAAAFFALLTALLYALLAGFNVPAQRTVYMLGGVTLALGLGRRIAGCDVLALALTVVLLADPWAVLAPGFWLSFGAVALILYVSSNRLARPRGLRGWLQVQWAITIGLTPLTIALFQQVSLASPLANAFAIPMVSLVVVPLTLLGLIVPLDAVLQVAAFLAQSCTDALGWLSAFPDAVWQQHAPSPGSLLVALGGVAWLLAPTGWPARWLGALALLPLITIEPAAPPGGQAWVDVLDVGQGLAVVVRTRTHVLVYDTGPRYSADADSGSRVVLPHLRGIGARTVDLLIVSHGDKDHSGGVQSVFDAVPVKAFITSMDEQEMHSAAKVARERCRDGASWEWDGVFFTLLHPPAGSYNASPTISSNDLSCVLRIDASGRRLLLTGDIERKAESQLLGRYGQPALRADVLLVPHHGSATSSTDAFVARVRPAIAIFAVGYRNRFGHPSAPVIRRYQDSGARIYRSDRDGAVMLKLSSSIEVHTWRRVHARYWQGM